MIMIRTARPSLVSVRLLEEQTLAGAVLVAACHTDLGEPNERQAGYYPPSGGEWKWDEIRTSANGNIVLLHSDDDPFIPIEEPRHIARALGPPSVLRECKGESHFFGPSEQIYEAVIAVVDAAEQAAAREINY